VRLTHQLLKHSESSREPFVDVFLCYPSPLCLSLKVTNLGLMPAKSIKFTVEIDCDKISVFGTSKNGIAHSFPIREGIAYLPAGQTLEYFIGHSSTSAAEDHIVKLSVHFQNSAGDFFNRHVEFNLRQYDEVELRSYFSDGDKIAGQIEQLTDYFRSREQDQGWFGATFCPTCSSQIPCNAKKCPQCLEWIETETQTDSSQNPS